MGEYNEEYLQDMLPLYYSRLFPYSLFYDWLTYGNTKKFEYREMSFTLASDVYLRYQSFENQEDLIKELQRLKPVKIDIGAIYSQNVNSIKKVPVEKEVVFDIDLTDYDDVRTCCSAANVCKKCWKFMVLACKIIDTTLREDFGFNQLLWVFSGRRGVHCWVCDDHVRAFNDEQRSGVAEYLQLARGSNFKKQISLYSDKIHALPKRALEIIQPYFEEMMLKEQDILGTEERIKNFLAIVDEEVRASFETVICNNALTNSVERWNEFVKHHKYLFQKQSLPRYCKSLPEEIMLQYCYPRLDINVTKGINHLLKAPFCVHPKTGKICIPFSLKVIDKFDPSDVPTISLLVEEINAHDKTTKEIEEKSNPEINKNDIKTNLGRIKDYKKTSIIKSIRVFEEFMNGLKKKGETNDMENLF